METEKWGKEAYRMGLDLEEVVQSQSRQIQNMQNDFSSVNSHIDTLTTNLNKTNEIVDKLGSQSSEGSSLELIGNFFGYIKYKKGDELASFLGSVKCQEETYGELNIEFDLVSVVAGTTGDVAIKIKIGDDIIYSKDLTFSDAPLHIREKALFYSDGTKKEVYVLGRCLTIDETNLATACFLKNVNLYMVAKKPEFMEECSGARVEEIPPSAFIKPGYMYIMSNDAYGIHVKEYSVATEAIFDKDSETKFIFGGESALTIKLFKTAVMQTYNEAGALLANAGCFRLADDGHLTGNQPLLPQTTMINAGTNTIRWYTTGLLDIYNANRRGIGGDNSATTGNYYALIMGYTNESSSMQAQGIRNGFSASRSNAFDVETPFDNIKEIFSVSNIQSNIKNYGIMPIFQNQSDELYFQGYKIKANEYLLASDVTAETSGTFYTKNENGTYSKVTLPADFVENTSYYIVQTENWLEIADGATKIGVGKNCTAFCDGNSIRFYFVRNNKIYKTSLNLTTRQVSDEVFVAKGQYYKECTSGFWRRNEGILTYVKKQL